MGPCGELRYPSYLMPGSRKGPIKYLMPGSRKGPIKVLEGYDKGLGF